MPRTLGLSLAPECLPPDAPPTEERGLSDTLPAPARLSRTLPLAACRNLGDAPRAWRGPPLPPAPSRAEPLRTEPSRAEPARPLLEPILEDVPLPRPDPERTDAPRDAAERTEPARMERRGVGFFWVIAAYYVVFSPKASRVSSKSLQ